MTVRARQPQPKQGMNKTEAAYALWLDALKSRGEIRSWRFEPIKLRLAKATFYTPDFMVVTNAFEMELHEVKGHWEDDARVKVKVVAEQFPEFAFRAVQKDGRLGWKVEEF